MLAISQFIIYNQVSMSIPNIFHKIKGNPSIDKISIVYLLIIFGVGISSFALGRMSNNSYNQDNNMAAVGTKSLTPMNDELNSNMTITQTQFAEKRYVASKNGKMYYNIDCSGVKRIKEENRIWFNSKEDAEKSGYTLSSLCQ
jgi:hypothetical protein